MTSFEEVMSSLDDKQRKNFMYGSDVELVRLPTPSVGLTESLGGGWGFGRQVMTWGTKSAGKSTFWMQQIAVAQALGYSCAYFDVEGTFDKQWAERLGVNNDELIYRKSKSVNKVVNDGVALLKARVDLLIVDSITAMVPAAYLDEDELKPIEKTNAIGSIARDTSKALSMMNYENEDTLLALVSQVRAKSSGMYWGLGATNGNAPEFYSSQVVKMFSSEGGTNTIEGEVVNNDLVIKKPIGRRVNYTVQFNKLGPQGHVGEYNLYYDGDFVGIDTAGELLEIAVKKGVVKKGGSWYSFDDKKLGQGAVSVAKLLRDDKALFEEVRSGVEGNNQR